VDFKAYKKCYYVIPLIRYIDYIDIYIKDHINKKTAINSNINYNGFYGLENFFNYEEFQKFKKENPNYALGFKPNPEKLYLYKEIINNCKSNNIKLNIVIAPMYYEGKDIIKSYKETIDTYRQWAERDSLPFIDFSNDSIYQINRDTAYFYNCMHLNSKGADKFTSEMYVPWIKELVVKN